MANKDLHTLIRLRKWDVDEKQRALGVLIRQEEGVLERIDALAKDVQKEMAVAAQLPADQRSTLTGFLKRCEHFREALNAALADIRGRMVVAQDNLAEAYRRHKTVEVTQDQRDLAEEKEQARVDTIELDEIGLNLHRRKTA